MPPVNIIRIKELIYFVTERYKTITSVSFFLPKTYFLNIIPGNSVTILSLRENKLKK